MNKREEMKPREESCNSAKEVGGWILKKGCQKFKEMGSGFELNRRRRRKRGRRL